MTYGSAVVIKTETGSLVVAGWADKTLGVHVGVYEQMLPGHRHENGDIQLDCAGRWRYRLVGKDTTHPEVLIFELLPNASEHFAHHPQNHHPDASQKNEEAQG